MRINSILAAVIVHLSVPTVLLFICLFVCLFVCTKSVSHRPRSRGSEAEGRAIEAGRSSSF